MAIRKTNATVFGLALALGGCTFAEEALWPSLTGERAQPAQQVQIAPSAAEQQQRQAAQAAIAVQPPPALGTGTFAAPEVTPGQPTGTFVGQKVVQFRGELRQMQQSLANHNTRLQQVRNKTVQDSQRYHGTVAAINARLQVGTTPGNPVLVQQWKTAQTELDGIVDDIARMNALATDVSSDSTMAAYLLESVRAAYGLAGAVDEDHRQLAILEDDTNRTVVVIDRLLNELTEDITRQGNYLSSERSNLTTLSLAIKNGELYGSSLASRAYVPLPSGQVSEAAPAIGPGASVAAGSGGRRPLVVIRFDRPNVAYEQALYTAVSRALERRPQAMFDLVAVSPSRGGASQPALSATSSRRHAETVLRSLTEMGLPPERVRLSAMSSATAQTSEVHIYVR
ncbi:MAG: hypothetical protein HY521_05685 [Proteobacteria bacterium]|nr:hypothetical protein [Pseudomonadota bacterium]